MKDGLFIVIEGPDASGKETQAEMLVDTLREQGYDVYAQEFPAYDETEAGEKLRSYLQSEEANELTTEALAQLYIQDRKEKKDDLESALAEGHIVVADRYAQSNYAYQTAHHTPEERWQFIDWMKQQERELPDPDVVLYMDTPVKQCKELMNLQGRDRDRNEADEGYLRKVKAAYREIADQEQWIRIEPMKRGWSWHTIKGTDQIQSPEQIHKQIMDTVEPYLPDQ